MLSEGEYVVPADVLRYYGVNFFENLRGQAKQGLQSMEANGRIGGEPMSPQQVQQNMSGQPMAGAPAVQPIAANAGVITTATPDLTNYAQQAQQLGGQPFNAANYTTVGGTLFEPEKPKSITLTKTFVNSENPSDKRVVTYVDGAVKPPSDIQYTQPPYYEQGTTGLVDAIAAFEASQNTGGGSGGEDPTVTPQGKTYISAFSGEGVNISDPLASAKIMFENANKGNFGGGMGLLGAGMIGGPAGMGLLGVGQTVSSLDNISDLNAMALLATAQGKTADAEAITKMVNDITGKSNLASQSLSKVFATGVKKAQGVIDRLGLDLDIKNVSKWTDAQIAQVAERSEYVQSIADADGIDPALVFYQNADLSNIDDAQQHANENPGGVTVGDPAFQQTLSTALETGDLSSLLPPGVSSTASTPTNNVTEISDTADEEEEYETVQTNKGGLMSKGKKNKK